MTWQKFHTRNWQQFKARCDGAPIHLDEIAQEASYLTTKSRQELRELAREYIAARDRFEAALEQAGIQRG